MFMPTNKSLQLGIINPATVLIVLAAIAVLVFILVTSNLPFRNSQLNSLYPKPTSQAAGEVVNKYLIGLWSYANPDNNQVSRMAEAGTLSMVAYYNDSTPYTPTLYFRDSSTGGTSTVKLPVDNNPDNPFHLTGYVLTSSNELWVSSGGVGNIAVRQYQLSGSPLPTSASLISVKYFGDVNSRSGDFIKLKSGALVLTWHQHSEFGGATVSQGVMTAYRSASGAWSTTPLITGMTTSSIQTAVQHPADNSVWIFVSADASALIQAYHFTEGASGLTFDWYKKYFISQYTEESYTTGTYVAQDGPNAGDSELPPIRATSDPFRNEIALSYPSLNNRVTSFINNGWYTSNNPVVAHIAADGSKSFSVLPYLINGYGDLEVVAVTDTQWVMYHPVTRNQDQTLSCLGTYIISLSNNTWGTPIPLATWSCPTTGLGHGVGISRAEFYAQYPDNNGYFYTLGSPSTGGVDTTPPTVVIVNPVNGAAVPKNSTVTISATASDNVGIAKVEFRVGNTKQPTCTDTTAPYSCDWTVPKAGGSKSYVLKATAFDKSNNQSSSSVTVTSR